MVEVSYLERYKRRSESFRYRKALREKDVPWKICPDCKSLMPVFLRKHHRRDCPGYSPLWAGDVRRKLFEALQAYDAERREHFYANVQVRMITVTAPGVDHGLPWDEGHCRWRGKHRHSGTVGCRVLPEAAEEWNGGAASRWRELHKRAGNCSRIGGSRVRVLARMWELQKRGVLHVHLLVGYTGKREKACADRYVSALSRLAPDYVFGFVDRKPNVKEPSAGAAYLAAYFVSGKGSKLSLHESVREPGLPPSICYVKAELSQRSGVTMRSLRLRRFLWHAIGQSGLDLLDRYLSIDYSEARFLYLMGLWQPEILSQLVRTKGTS